MKNIGLLLLCSFSIASFGQKIVPTDTTDILFTGTRINPYLHTYDSTGRFTLSGYIDTYGASYSDENKESEYVKFPTSAPRNNQFGLNILQLSARYESTDFHGTGTLFYGDIPASAWSVKFNPIQEANVGFRVWRKLWLDAGFFRTHIGLESIQPRENMTISFATTSYFEPYFLSGGKLTWAQSEKWSFQLNVFNGFNTFVENNANKAIGASVSYTNKSFQSTFSVIACDESPDGTSVDQTRLYNNWIGVYKTNRWSLGYEVNYGIQTNSTLVDSSKTAFVFSTLLATKYRLTSKLAGYIRYEYFNDLNEILTGPVENQNHQLIGLELNGLTLGIEFKPIPNSYLRLETRYLTATPNERIFYSNGKDLNYRYEFIAGLGVWF
jgi:hypothetical protein